MTSRIHFAVALLAAFAAIATAMPMVAADGRWVQLGAPVRAGSPLLRDEAHARLVMLGADAFGSPPTIADALEFREPCGWSRIELPHPPVEPGGMRRLVLADHARGRFLMAEYVAGPSLRVRLWALELGPPARWVQLDRDSLGPLGDMELDAKGTAVWAFQRYPARQLWCRSLADTGQWRVTRALPPDPSGLQSRVIDIDRRRVVALCRRAATTDSVVVVSLPLDSDEGWSDQPRSGTWAAWPHASVTVFDAARDRVLLLAWDESGATRPPSWSYDLTPTGTWSSIGATLEDDPGALAVSGDSLWGWRHDANRQDVEVVAVSLAAPRQVRTALRAAWPGFWWFDISVRDPAHARWLFAGGRNPNSAMPFPMDSLEQLMLDGDGARWSTIGVIGESPHDYYDGSWTREESQGTLYFLCRIIPWMHAGIEEEQLWALYPESPPRWALVWHGPSISIDDIGGLAFDPRSRRLIRMGLGNDAGPGNELIFSMSLDDPQAWETLAPVGSAPRYVEHSSIVMDPSRGRLVFAGFVSGVPGWIHALDLGGEPRWSPSGFSCDVSDPGDCIHQFTTGAYDPVARRVLQFGGWSMTEMTPYDDLWAIDSGDTLGPLRRMLAVGSPGWQEASPAAFDAQRDALLTFDFRTGGLYEFRFDRGRALVARPVSVVSGAEGNRLRWSGTPAGTFRLWRCAPPSGWAEYAAVTALPDGVMEFVDRAVESGVRYGYRLTTGASEFETAATDIWVTTISSGALALARPWPNPSRGSLGVAFTLATAAPADLDLFDVAGRRVWSRRFDAPTAGPHHMLVPAGELPRSGLLFLRLRQAGVSATRRVVMAR